MDMDQIEGLLSEAGCRENEEGKSEEDEQNLK